MPVSPTLPGALFARLRAAAGADWTAYVDHAFVRGMGDGSLPLASFRHYLIQDYLFLFQFARAYAMAAAKADTLADLRRASLGLSALTHTEMGLHVRYCADWGIDEAAMIATPEAAPTVAYTRYVLDRGFAGDLLDLHVALAPCMAGYAEIGARLAADPATKWDGNPYRSWIETYAGAEYQREAAEGALYLDELWARRGSDARFKGVAAIFRTATRLEADFWEMGLTAKA
jgi:thiaminase (transcriptional activator TenA)